MPLRRLRATASGVDTSSAHRLRDGIARAAADTTPSDGGVTIVLNSTTQYHTPDVRRCGGWNGMAMDLLFSAGRYQGSLAQSVNDD